MINNLCTLPRMPQERPIDIAIRLSKVRGWNQTELGAVIGATSAAISNWKARGMPADRHQAVAEALGITVDQLLGRVALIEDFDQMPPLINLENNPDYPAIRRVKFKLSAGASGFAVEYDTDDGAPIVFQQQWYEGRGLRPERLFAVKVANGSMEPGLRHGDTVVVNTESNEPKDGRVFAVNYEGELVIKRLVRDEGNWWLGSDNPDQRRYPRKLCDEHCTVIGEIVHKQSEYI